MNQWASSNSGRTALVPTGGNWQDLTTPKIDFELFKILWSASIIPESIPGVDGNVYDSDAENAFKTWYFSKPLVSITSSTNIIMFNDIMQHKQ